MIAWPLKHTSPYCRWVSLRKLPFIEGRLRPAKLPLQLISTAAGPDPTALDGESGPGPAQHDIATFLLCAIGVKLTWLQHMGWRGFIPRSDNVTREQS